MIIQQLLARFKLQADKKVRNYPFMMGEGIWLGSDHLNLDDTVGEILKHGTLTLGFIGLAECLKALIGKHHGESSEAQKLGMEIVGHMRKRMDQASEKYHMNFTLIATPAEGLSGRFVRIDKKNFGVIDGVTDRDYYTNSFHVPVYYPISIYEKVTLEAPYGGLVIHKTDSVTKKPLQGVEFRISTADGQLIPDNDGLTSSNGRYVTDTEGEIKLSNVKPGTYIVTETRTLDGYVINAEPQTVVVNPADIQTLNFTNEPKSSLTVRIIDKVTKEALPGAKVKIVNAKGELVQGTTGTTSNNGIYTADENGEISLGNVPPDTYMITQTETIDGYIMDSQAETVVIGAGDAKVITLTNTPNGEKLLVHEFRKEK